MLAGFTFEPTHYLLWLISSIYIVVAPVLLLAFAFYLMKLMLANLGIMLFIEKAFYMSKGMFEDYERFLNDHEKKLLSSRLNNDSSHITKWLLRFALFVMGMITCVPFFAASAMTVATMHAPAIIAYNMLVVGTIIPLIITTLLCEAIIYIGAKVKKSALRIRTIDKNLY